MHPIPRDVDELKAGITEVFATIGNAILGRVWQESGYWLGVCRVTKSAHIEHLCTFRVKIEIISFLELTTCVLISFILGPEILHLEFRPRLLEHPVL